MYDSLKPVVLTGTLQGSFLASFLLGWAVTTGAGIASYPLDTIRRRMMMTSGEKVHYKNMLDAGAQIVKTEGAASLFKGAGANILRGVAGAGVLSMYDKLQAILLCVYFLPTTSRCPIQAQTDLFFFSTTAERSTPVVPDKRIDPPSIPFDNTNNNNSHNNNPKVVCLSYSVILQDNAYSTRQPSQLVFPTKSFHDLFLHRRNNLSPLIRNGLLFFVRKKTNLSVTLLLSFSPQCIALPSGQFFVSLLRPIAS
jgi:hypothetical protein